MLDKEANRKLHLVLLPIDPSPEMQRAIRDLLMNPEKIEHADVLLVDNQDKNDTPEQTRG